MVDTVARLKPILNADAVAEKTHALATREAAASWQPGDAEIDVYATTNGRYYHLASECMGMRNAYKWHISDALDAGKDPCPVCVLGEDEADLEGFWQ